jgi:glycosyltransferase involved in cell wall biosynthesis
VHYVHHAWYLEDRDAPFWFRFKNWVHHKLAKRDEKKALSMAPVILTNSELTRRHVLDCFHLDTDRVQTVYLGSDPEWGPVTPQERLEARAWLGIPESRGLAVFVGALGFDRRKGFDLLLQAWERLCADPAWDVDVIAAGGGALTAWQQKIDRAGLANRVRLLGFSSQVHKLLAAADLLVSPVRYEPYGLNAQEALCREVPVMISAQAGIAERYPAELSQMLIPDPENIPDFVERLRQWRRLADQWKVRFQPLGEMLRSYTWKDMACNMVGVMAERDQLHSESPDLITRPA